MAYIALYRKYRPVTFKEIVGQDHIVQTLVNQIKFDKVGHAYLFTGTRGTGKTSTARIFARAVNCLQPKDGSPCGKCKVCKELNGINIDIIEIDAASNNGVDEIRDLRDKVNFAPSEGKYKVYIIDEVHMLSSAAFNALLKTLEEPPAHVIFILGTTEAHKMPATILSRCMRFDFKLVGIDKIKKLMASILKEAGKDFSDDALNAIAVAGEGSVRDALTILDRCVSFNEGKLEYHDVLTVLGATDRGVIFQLANGIFQNNSEEILSTINEISLSGKSISVLAKDMAGQMRDLLVIKACKKPQEILKLPKDILDRLCEQGKDVKTEKLLYALQLFNNAESELKHSLSPRVSFEVLCLKAAASSGEFNHEMLELRIKELEKRSFSGPAPQITKQEIVKDHAKGKVVWAKVLAELRAKDSKVLSAVCENVKSMYVLEKEFFVTVDDSGYVLISQQENLKLLSEIVKEKSKLVLMIEKAEKEKPALENDIDNLKKLFGEDIIKIEK